MYAFIEGKVCEKSGSELVILAGGVGYRLLCSMTTMQKLPPVGENFRCYTELSVREDAMELFGFATREEREMYRRLIAVSGVGPKMALALLGSMPLRDLNVAILMEDITALSRAPGVGKKTAQRIALELKDKVSQADVSQPAFVAGTAPEPAAGDNVSEALLALEALGYSAAEARGALSRLPDRSGSADELIRQALRGMAGM